METQILSDIWPLLVVLAVFMATAMLYILASRHNHALMIHDRVRESKVLRRQYEAAIRDKQDAH